MIARIMKYVFGVFVGLVLLAIVSFWVVLDGPKALWYKLFPIVEYDNLEEVLEVDGEVVTIRGTARCSITPSSGYSGGPNPARRKRWGGDATVVLKDGRALVVPYTNDDWCSSGRGARGFMRKWWNAYKKADFDERVPLEGHFPLLILDNGDAPTQIDLLLGPKYYAQPDTEIKLVSSARWASKEGPETYPYLEWLMGGDGAKVRQNKWMGGLITELSLTEIKANPIYAKFLPGIIEAISGGRGPRFGADLSKLIKVDPERTSFGVRLRDNAVSVSELREPSRVRLFNFDQFGQAMETVTGNIPSCWLRNRPWTTKPEFNFSYLNRNPKRLWDSPNIFWDTEELKILVGTYECVNTANITNRFQINKK